MPDTPASPAQQLHEQIAALERQNTILQTRLPECEREIIVLHQVVLAMANGLTKLPASDVGSQAVRILAAWHEDDVPEEVSAADPGPLAEPVAEPAPGEPRSTTDAHSEPNFDTEGHAS